MIAIRSILVAADSGEAAVAGAAALAARLGASHRLAGASADQTPRAVAESFLAEARSVDAGLLVIGVAPRAPLRDADWRIVRDSPCPVLITRGSLVAGYRRALVAVDPMHAHDKPAALDDELISAARMLLEADHGQLHLLHCYLPSGYLPMRAPGAAFPGIALGAHRDALQQLAGRNGIAPDRVRIEPCDARQGIPDAAAMLGADLVVMGAVARGRLKRLLIGSTTEAVLDRLGCDVLAVKAAPPAD